MRVLFDNYPATTNHLTAVIQPAAELNNKLIS